MKTLNYTVKFWSNVGVSPFTLVQNHKLSKSKKVELNHDHKICGVKGKRLWKSNILKITLNQKVDAKLVGSLIDCLKMQELVPRSQFSLRSFIVQKDMNMDMQCPVISKRQKKAIESQFHKLS